MGWRLSSWLAFARSFQLLASLAAAGMHGYLTFRIYSEKRGLSREMVVLELLAFVLLGYSTLVIFMSRRTAKTPWLTTFVVCDVLMSAGLLGIITTLARAGLPMHCAGLTQDSGHPAKGFNTTSFSDESPGQRGELDAFCGFDRVYYALANTLMFAYMFTITGTVLRIMEKKYTKTTKVGELLESLERADEIRMKVLDSPSPIDTPSPDRSTPSLNMPPPQPSSEGILTRNTSLRSNFTTVTSIAPSHTGPYRPDPIPRRPVGQRPAPIPQRSLPPLSPSSAFASTSTNPSAGFVPVPLDEEDSSEAEAALVADGMHHGPPSSHNHHHYHQRHHQQQHHPSQPHHHHPHQPHNPPFPRMPILSEEDQDRHHHHNDEPTADSALVSDGMRPSEPTLPPYHPGSRRMSGHGGEEDNDMRLSGYVKGQTRAQDMKDSGGF